MKILKYLPLVGAMALVSCDDYLDKTPDNRVIISTPEQIRQLLINAYSEANYATLCEFSSDNIVDNNAPDDNGVRYNLTYLERTDLEAFSFDDVVSGLDQDSPSYVWSGCYHAIAVCNNALQAIEKLEAEGRGDEVKPHKGEALISRAYHHFILANLFAMPYAGPTLSESILAIPYMTDVEDKLIVKYDRESLASVYRKIQADIEEGLPLIDDALYDVPKYHFNKKAANAFAARFYLYSRQYDKAEKCATDALGGPTGNPATMMRSFWAQTFTSSDANTMYYTSASEPSNLMLMATGSRYARSRGSRFAINGDAKFATIYGKGPTWTQYNFHPCYSGKLYLRGSQEYGLFFLKAGEVFEYTDKIAGIGYPHIIRCEFTAEEALLTRAEARLYLGKVDDAIADMRIWDEGRQNCGQAVSFPTLSRSNIISFYQTNDPGYGICKPLNIDRVCPSDQYQLTDDIWPFVQCVLHFRRIETIDDGLRFFDIKRYGIEITHRIGRDRVETLTIDDPRRALQIPTDVLSAGFAPNRKPFNMENPPVAFTGSFMN